VGSGFALLLGGPVGSNLESEPERATSSTRVPSARILVRWRRHCSCSSSCGCPEVGHAIPWTHFLTIGALACSCSRRARRLLAQRDDVEERPSRRGGLGNTTTTWTTTTSTTTTGTWTGAGGAGASASFGAPVARSASRPGWPRWPGRGSVPGRRGRLRGPRLVAAAGPLPLADDSNSMASPAHARELLNLFMGPSDYLRIRTYEFLNYYRIAFRRRRRTRSRSTPRASSRTGQARSPARGAIVRRPPPAPPHDHHLRARHLGLDGRQQHRAREGGREGRGKSLATGDIVSMVTWSDQQSTVLAGHVATGPNDATVVAAANGLAANGSTDLHAGLVRATSSRTSTTA